METPQHRMPEHRRKNVHRAPAGSVDAVNTWVLGHARAVKLVASLDRAGHQTMLARLSTIIRTMTLTREQMLEVQAEMQARRALIENCSRLIANAQARINQQYDKETRHVSDEERNGYTVPGPNDPHSTTATATIKATVTLSHKAPIRKSDAGKESIRQTKFDTSALTNIFK